MFRNLFKAGNGIKNVVTVFHAPQQPASMRVVALLKQKYAETQSNATIDQAGQHPQRSKTEPLSYEIQYEEAAPTTEQLASILEYIGHDKIHSVVPDATDGADAMQKIKKGSSLQLPLTVDWNNGRVVSGDNESEILKLLRDP